MNQLITYTPLGATHPGETIEELLEEHGMTSKELAQRTGISEKHLSEILNGKSGISTELALALERVFKTPAKVWLNLQKNYEQAQAKLKQEIELEKAIDWSKKFPYTELSKLGIVKQTRKAKERVEELLNFFSVRDVNAWEKVYKTQYVPVAFKTTYTSQKHTNIYSLTSWLRIGEILAENLNSTEFDPQKLRNLLPEFKTLMNNNANWIEIQKLALSSGLKVVFIPKIKGISLTGATRWYHNSPVIMLSDLYKRYDLIWFAFFHEIGHILLHGKREIFLEFKDMDSYSKEEREADRFAEQQLLPRHEFEKIKIEINKNGYSDKLISSLSYKYNIHPSIIIGRLWHYNLLDSNLGHKFIIKTEFTFPH